jgi:hypothetical protein
MVDNATAPQRLLIFTRRRGTSDRGGAGLVINSAHEGRPPVLGAGRDVARIAVGAYVCGPSTAQSGGPTLEGPLKD